MRDLIYYGYHSIYFLAFLSDIKKRQMGMFHHIPTCASSMMQLVLIVDFYFKVDDTFMVCYKREFAEAKKEVTWMWRRLMLDTAPSSTCFLNGLFLVVICLYCALLFWCGIWWLLQWMLIACLCTIWNVAFLTESCLSTTEQRWIKQVSLFEKKIYSNPLNGQEH